MGDLFAVENWGRIAAVVTIGFFVLQKIGSLKFRKRAVEVSGQVLKIFPYSRHTAYFIAYEYQGTRRVAEYSGLPLVPEYKVGEQLQIMIDGSNPPNVELPDKRPPSTGTGAACYLPGEPLISLLDILIVGVCIFAIVRGPGSWLR
jgi:hypothetical protein